MHSTPANVKAPKYVPVIVRITPAKSAIVPAPSACETAIQP